MAAIVERIEFDPATDAGHIHYRIGLSGAKFTLSAKTPRISGVSWRPHGNPPQNRHQNRFSTVLNRLSSTQVIRAGEAGRLSAALPN